jgi:hypothetical protein
MTDEERRELEESVTLAELVEYLEDAPQGLKVYLTPPDRATRGLFISLEGALQTIADFKRREAALGGHRPVGVAQNRLLHEKQARQVTALNREVYRLKTVLHKVADELDNKRHAAQGPHPLAHRLRKEADDGSA